MIDVFKTSPKKYFSPLKKEELSDDLNERSDRSVVGARYRLYLTVYIRRGEGVRR